MLDWGLIMKFVKTEMNLTECYISDTNIYKCINRQGWRAYFKPTGWKSFGNTCEYTRGVHESKAYKTLKQAISACIRHAKTFGNNPNSGDKTQVSY